MAARATLDRPEASNPPDSAARRGWAGGLLLRPICCCARVVAEQNGRASARCDAHRTRLTTPVVNATIYPGSVIIGGSA